MGGKGRDGRLSLQCLTHSFFMFSRRESKGIKGSWSVFVCVCERGWGLVHAGSGVFFMGLAMRDSSLMFLIYNKSTRCASAMGTRIEPIVGAHTRAHTHRCLRSNQIM